MGLSSTDKLAIGLRTSFPCLIIILTGLRLYVRGRQRWQWDDALVCIGCIWTIVGSPAGIELELRIGNPDSTQIALIYINQLSFLGSLWFARASILQTVVQITPAPEERRRRSMILLLFAFLCIFEMVEFFVVCHPKDFWGFGGYPRCFGKDQRKLVIAHLTGTVISDSILLILPLITLSALRKSAPRILLRLSLAFLASICTTTLSAVASWSIIAAPNAAGGNLGLIEGYTAMIVCNIPVLVVAVCRALGLQDLSSSNNKSAIEFMPRSRTGNNSKRGSAAGWSSVSRVLKPTATSTNPPLQSVIELQERSTVSAAWDGGLFKTGFREDEYEYEDEVVRFLKQRRLMTALRYFRKRGRNYKASELTFFRHEPSRSTFSQ